MTFKTKLVAGLLAASGALIVVAALSYLSLVQNASDRRWVIHTYQVLEVLDQLQTSIIEAETTERGYILTGEVPFLQAHNSADGQARHEIEELRSLTADNALQQHTLDQLVPPIQKRLTELRDRIDIRTWAGLQAGASSVKAGSEEHLLDQIRILISSMKQEEKLLLVQRAAELEASSSHTRLIIIIGQGLGFLFLLLAGLVIQQEMVRRRNADEQVRHLNSVLEQRIAERTAELAERARDLERSNTELQQFAYVASHDLQEPLRTISSFTQLLAKRYRERLDDKAIEFIDFAVDGCKRMQTLINDLLAFSRVGTQGKPLEPTSCDTVLDRVLKNLKMAIQETAAVVTRDPLPVVLADDGQLGQLLQNLLANAIKFRGAEAPRIHIAGERNDAAWTISVRDNGIGISTEHRDRIFVIFQRLHTKAQYPGTGIGLAVCKKIVERQGGRIWFEPAPGGGSVFCFTALDASARKNEGKEQHELRAHATAS